VTVNWCREFAVNFAISLKKSAVNFALFDRDLRTALINYYLRASHMLVKQVLRMAASVRVSVCLSVCSHKKTEELLIRN